MPAKDKFKPSRPAEPWTSSSEGDDSSTPSPDSSILPDQHCSETVATEGDPDFPHYMADSQFLDSLCHTSEMPWWRDQDSIVISGVSCRFPESDTMEEFAEHLLNGEDLVTENDRRWEPGLYDLPRRHAKLKELRKFDAQFFGVHPKQANFMDPQLRLLLEVAYEAIMDSGVNPQTLRGSRTGVFVGCSASETAGALTQNPETVVGYTLTGCTRSMFANRLSYSFDFRGPSFAVDTACSSSLLALQLAVDAIRQDQCDAALVAGAHLTLTPTTALQFLHLGMLSPSGASQSFDANGDGYVRSEGIGAILLQKSSVAHRCYATVVHAKSNTDGYKEQGITFPSGERQAQLLEEVYREAGIDPSSVAYVETHGTGTKVGDPQEANAIAEVFCHNRNKPLLIGSVKSSMGHAEPASGLASVAKILIAMESGYIPPNLHYTEPNPYIPGLVDGRLKVVEKKTEWSGGLVGINSFGFGGANTHVVLRSYPKGTPEQEPVQETNFPKILCYAGRTPEAVETVLKAGAEHENNPYFYALLAEQSNLPTNTSPLRGYVLLKRDTEDPLMDVQKVPFSGQRPVWFIYSGMGAQWAGMGQDLMRIEVFRNSVKQCSEALRPLGVDPYSLIMKGDDDVFKNTMHSMVCITAIQIGLTDVLRRVGIEPDGIVGHSTGEMTCGYCDGGMTKEQTMLCAYYRGQLILNGKFPPGAMAAVGLTWQEAKDRLPDGVIPACHNGRDSVTISGEEDKVMKVVEELTEEGVFAKMVNSSGIAFHSPFMQLVKENMLKHMRTVLPNPKPRSDRWISSSVPEHRWETELALTCSAEYQVNNAMSPVLFYEALQKIPENAVTIEIAPHCLLQAILRRSLHSSCTNVGLMKAKNENNLEFFLQAVGKMYQAGLPVAFQRLYPRVTFPVPRGTPMISPLIQWDHSQNWPVISAKDVLSFGGGAAASTSFTFDPFASDSKDKYLLDHVIDGRVLFPFTGHLIMVWKAACKLRGLDYQKTQVTLEEVSVYRPTIVTKPVKFDVVILPGSGKFTVLEGDSLTAAGTVAIVEEPEKPFFYDEIDNYPPKLTCERIELNTPDVYKEFLLRGYEYGPNFRGIFRACNSGDRGTLYWTGNWVTFLDSLLQTALLAERADTLRLPTRLRYIRIDPVRHAKSVVEEDDLQVVHSRNDMATNGCVAGGVEVCDLTAQTVPRRLHSSGKVTLEKVFFMKLYDCAALEDTPDKQSSLLRYGALCRSALVEGLKQWGSETIRSLQNGAVLEKALKDQKDVSPIDEDYLVECMEDSRCTLIQMIRKVFATETVAEANTFCMNVLNTVKTEVEGLGIDCLWNQAWQQKTLKPLLDGTVENTAGHYDRCCAFEPVGLEVVKLNRDMQTSHPLVEAEWTVIETGSSQVDPDLLAQMEVTAVKFDLESGDSVPDSVKNCDIVALDRVLSRKTDIPRCLQKVKEFMRDDGFAIVCEPTSHYEISLFVEALRGMLLPASGDGSRIYGMFLSHEDWIKHFKDAGFRVTHIRRDVSMISSLYMLRKIPSEVREPSFINVDDVEEFSWIEPLQQKIEETLNEPDSKTIWVTSTDRRDNGAVGLALCLREESSKANRFRRLCDVSLRNRDAPPVLDLNSTEVQDHIAADLHATDFRDGEWGSFVHMVMRDDEIHSYVETEHAFVNTLVRGDLSSLCWVESPNKYWDVSPLRTPTQELCSVYYASVNFRDVMLASGRLPTDSIPGQFLDRECLLGMEFSGRLNKNGHRVMGLLPAQALATTVVVDEKFSWEIPDEWTLDQAATVPVVYCTAYYALVVRGRIRRGDKVLIHSGSGGVGQAAISVALAFGCEVFTTVGTEEKKVFLKKRFPQLKDKHFSNSRTTEFEWRVRQATRGRGVDIILNSLSEEKLQASLRCLAQHGRFLEIGKFDLSNNANLGMALFLKNVTFHGILLDALMDGDNPDWLVVAELLQKGINSGVVQPLPSTVFPHENAEEAFRYMAHGKHIGKVLMEIRPEEPEATIPTPVTVRAVCRSLCHPQHVYLITGGLGGFGLELARWLIHRGARKLVLTSRSGIRTGYQARCIYFWRRSGISILVSTLNIAEEKEAARLIRQCQDMGPLGGIFHLAMVLRDCLFENQSAKNFQEAAAAKYWGTRNLDKVTRKMCGEELKWFVVYSSITSARGNAGQTNYGWANSTMERVVEQRRADGYAGIAVQWGAIGDVGVILENMGDNTTVVGGTLPQRMPSCLQALDVFLMWNHPIVASFVRAETGEKKGSSGSGDIAQAIAHILGVNDVSQLDPNANLGDLGLDSLMGVEIKQALERDYDIVLNMKDIRNLTLNKLKDLSECGGGAAAQEIARGVGSQRDEEELSEEKSQEREEIERQMLQLFRLRVDVNDLMPSEKLAVLNEVKAGPPVFFVHSIEGIGTPLKNLAVQLTIPAYCFQSIPSAPHDSIENLARFYIQVMKERQPRGPYRIIGYSYGACVAFEMATQLQAAVSSDPNENAIHSLVLLDGSHHYMQTYRKVYRAAYGVAGSKDLSNDPLFETELLSAWTLRFANVDYKAFRMELLAQPNWKARVKKVVAAVMTTGLFKSPETLSWSCDGLRQKFLAADKYNPIKKFDGNITLVRAEQGAGREEDVGRDYGVGEVASGIVNVHVVEGDHDTFVQGSSSGKTASIIMETLLEEKAPT